jgi:hypothetical protein
MKLDNQIILFGVVLLLLILISLGTVEPVAHQPQNLFSNHSSMFEGFLESSEYGKAYPENISVPGSTTENSGHSKKEFAKTQGNTASSGSSFFSSMNQQQGSLPTTKKVEGFEGLRPSPVNNDPQLDYFSHLQGNTLCSPSPYSNSNGYLCLDDKAMNLLQTRGANSTGKDSQIGTA